MNQDIIKAIIYFALCFLFAVSFYILWGFGNKGAARLAWHYGIEAKVEERLRETESRLLRVEHETVQLHHHLDSVVAIEQEDLP